MLIVYCETCGFRIQADELNNGSAVQTAENRYNCGKCAAAAAAATVMIPAKRTSTSGIPVQRRTPDDGQRPPSGGTAVITRPKSTVVRTASTQAVPAAGESEAGVQPVVRKAFPVVPAIAGAATVLVVVAVVFALSSGDKGETVAQNKAGAKAEKAPAESTDKRTPTPEASAQPAPMSPEERVRKAMEDAAKQSGVASSANPAQPAPANATRTNTPAGEAAPALPGGGLGLLSSAKTVDDNVYNSRAAALLKEAQDWFAQNSADPWTYKDMLEQLTHSYRSAPATQEAKALIAALKLPPDSERPQERMNWHKDWKITEGASQTSFHAEFDGRKYIYQSHPIDQGKPTSTTRTLAVPNERSFLEIRMRGHDQGDHRFALMINGQEQFAEDVGGREWRNFTIDLTPLKGRDAEVSLVHHNTGWACEFAYFQVPRFVDKPASNAKVFSMKSSGATPPTDVAAKAPATEAAKVAVNDKQTSAESVAAEYAALSDDAYAAMAKGNLRAGKEILEKMSSDSRFGGVKSKIENDLALVKMAEANVRAIAKGAHALADNRPFIFNQSNGKTVTVGRGTKNSVKDATDMLITIEQDLGGGKALTKIAVEHLTPLTRFELVRIGTQKDPDGSLSAALGALLLVRGGNSELGPRAMRSMLDAAKKTPGSEKMVAHLTERFEAAEREGAAEAAYKKVEQALANAKSEDARKLLDVFQKEHAATAFAARNKEGLAKFDATITRALAPLDPGLIWDYCQADGNDRFKHLKLTKVEPKLSYEWGDNAPAGGVPDNFSVRARGVIRIEKAGRYGFWFRADDYGLLKINGQRVVEASTNSTGEGELDLPAGDHAIEVEFQDTGGAAVLQVRWRLVGAFDLQDIPESLLFHDPRKKSGK